MPRKANKLKAGSDIYAMIGTKEKILESRMQLCKPLVDTLIGFTSIDEAALDKAVGFAAMIFKPGTRVQGQKLEQLLTWARRAQADACLLQLMLAGIIDIAFIRGKPAFAVAERKEAEARMKEFKLDEYLKLWKKLDKLKSAKGKTKSK